LSIHVRSVPAIVMMPSNHNSQVAEAATAATVTSPPRLKPRLRTAMAAMIVIAAMRTALDAELMSADKSATTLSNAVETMGKIATASSGMSVNSSNMGVPFSAAGGCGRGRWGCRRNGWGRWIAGRSGSAVRSGGHHVAGAGQSGNLPAAVAAAQVESVLI